MRSVVYACLMCLAVTVFAGCGSAVKSIDFSDPNRQRLTLDWDPSDVDRVVNKMVSSMTTDEPISLQKPGVRPLVFFLSINNRTREHIETKELEAAIKVAATKSKTIKFTAVADIPNAMVEQLGFQKSALADPTTARQFGKMRGWQYTLYGQITDNVQSAGRTTEKTYRISLCLADIETGVIEWTDEEVIGNAKKKALIGY